MMCRASRAQACSVCTPLLEAIEWPSVRTMRASTRASQHARRCASPRAVCAGVARAFTSLLHGRVSCHVVLVRYSFSRYSFSASKCMRGNRPCHEGVGHTIPTGKARCAIALSCLSSGIVRAPLPTRRCSSHCFLSILDRARVLGYIYGVSRRALLSALCVACLRRTAL